MQIKEGSIWSGGDKKFRVISVSEVDGHTWVYYREEPQRWKPASELKEFSCYQESFISRFNPLPE
jgi:hypothetical protein